MWTPEGRVVDLERQDVIMEPTSKPSPHHEVRMRQEPQAGHRDDLNRRVAGIIRRKRAEKNLTQAELAKAANLSRTSIAFIEGAKQECGLDTFVRVALALGTEPHQLLQEVWSPAVVEDPFVLKVLKKASQ